MNEDRWPPVYDFESLLEQIEKLQSRDDLFNHYYSISPQSNYFQGDIIELSAEFPFITNEGNIAVDEVPIRFWIIIGNTCDLSLPGSRCKFSNIIPLETLEHNIPETVLESLKKYEIYKKFFIPTWDESISQNGFVADFTKITTIEKKVISPETNIKIKEMNQLSWVLLHSCFVRYLARDDGRHD